MTLRPVQPVEEQEIRAHALNTLHQSGTSVQTPRRLRLYLRIAISLLAATFVWLLAEKHAQAAAPLCDARGAITFAPPPTLEEPNASVDIGQADDCSDSRSEDIALQHGQRGPSSQTAAEDGARALAATSPVILPASFADVLEAKETTFVPPSGVSSRLDRPPR